MNRCYRLVVFDWEGTLGDTLGPILKKIADAAKRLQLGEFDERIARQYVVLGLTMAVQKLFPRLSIYQHEQLLQAVQESMLTASTHVCLFPGALQMVQHIQEAGIDVAIATNKGQQSLQRALQVSGLDVFFKITRSAGQAPPKPCPQMLQEIMDVFGVDAVQTLMVGDSVSDVEMAKQIHVDAVGVDFYHQQEANLRAAGALDVFDDYQQLARYLQL